MGKIVLDEPLATQIRLEAEALGVDVEAFVEAAVKHYRFKMQKEKLDAEAQWWRSQLDDVRKRYSGEYVAIHHQEVVDHDVDEDMLLKRIRAKYGKTTNVQTRLSLHKGLSNKIIARKNEHKMKKDLF